MTVNWKKIDGDGKAEQVKLAWKPNYSASKIAEVLSAKLQKKLTRNAIMGVYDRNPTMRKTHPLGGSGAVKQRLNAEKRARLSPEERAAKAKLAAKLAEERKQKREARRQRAEVLALLPRELTPLEIKQAALDYDQNSLRLPLEELETRQCRWPVNDPEPKGQYLFCGHNSAPGFRYCKHHARRSVIPTPQPKRRKPRV